MQESAQKQQREGCLGSYRSQRNLLATKPSVLEQEAEREKYLRLLLWGILGVQVLSYHLFRFIFWFFTKRLCF